MAVMTRHERCLAAIAGRPVDRAPTYLPGMSCEVASKILGRKVNAGTGSLLYAEARAWMKGDAAHSEFEHRLHEDLADLYRTLDIDVHRMPWRICEKPALQPDENTFVYGDPDGEHRVYKYVPESGDFGLVAAPGPGHADYETRMLGQVEAQEAAVREGALEDIAVPDEHKLVCRRYGREFFVVCNGGAVCVGMDTDSLMLLATNPELVRRKVMLQARGAVAMGRALKREGLPGVLVAGGDLAGNDGPFYSPESFRQVMLPALKYLAAQLAETGTHYIFRSDGNMWPVADMLFKEAGLPAFGEVDRDAGMTVGALRRRYPRLVCWGNMSVNQLARRSAQWVRDEARRIIDESGGTGYFHGPSNAVMRDVPVENVEAMFDVR